MNETQTNLLQQNRAEKVGGGRGKSTLSFSIKNTSGAAAASFIAAIKEFDQIIK